MAYIPTAEDVRSLKPSDNSGYIPSREDIASLKSPSTNGTVSNILSKVNSATEEGNKQSSTQKNLSSFGIDEPIQGDLKTIAGSVFAGPALKVLGKVASPLTNALLKVKPTEVAKSIQDVHDLEESQAANMFEHVGSEAEKRGITSIPIEEKMIDAAKRFFPNTDAAKNLIEQAKSGEYSSLRNLQSDLWKRGTKYLKSDLIQNNHKGEEAMELRDKINDIISGHLKEKGSHDLSDILDLAKVKYKNLKDTYYGEYVPAAIKKLVQKGSRKIPKNIFDILSEESEPMERIRNQNPFATSQLKNVAKKENAIRRLKWGAGLVGGGEAIHAAYNIFGSDK